MKRSSGGIAPLAIATGCTAVVAAGIIMGLISGVPARGASDEPADKSSADIAAFDSIADAVSVEPYENTVSLSEGNAETLAATLETDEVTAKKVVSLSEKGDATAAEYSDALGNDDLYEVGESQDGDFSIYMPFASKRLVVPCQEEASLPETSPVAQAWDPMTESMVMTYGTMEDTLSAFNTLESALGEDSVMVDCQVHSEGSSSAYRGWGVSDMQLTQAESLLDSSKNTAPVKVAVIDSGIRKSHKIFSGVTIDPASGSLISIRRTALSSSNYADDNGHGTYVAGVVATGTPDKVSILVLKCLDSNGDGSLYDVYYAMKYAAAHGASVVNLSIGSSFGTGSAAQSSITVFDRAMRSVTSNDGIVVAAASNDGWNMDDHGTYPAVSKYVQTVGALEENGKRAQYSNYGSSLDFVAPGSNVLGAWSKSDTQTVWASGTSMAAPHMAAFFADLRCAYPDKSSEEIVSMARTMVVDLGASGKDSFYGYGKPVMSTQVLKDGLAKRENPSVVTPEPQEPQQEDPVIPIPTPIITPEPIPTPTPTPEPEPTPTPVPTPTPTPEPTPEPTPTPVPTPEPEPVPEPTPEPTPTPTPVPTPETPVQTPTPTVDLSQQGANRNDVISNPHTSASQKLSITQISISAIDDELRVSRTPYSNLNVAPYYSVQQLSNGSYPAKTFNLRIMLNGVTIGKSEYTVEYDNNRPVSTERQQASFTIKATANSRFTGEVRYYFVIAGKEAAFTPRASGQTNTTSNTTPTTPTTPSPEPSTTSGTSGGRSRF